jgi:hypothetical protein
MANSSSATDGYFVYWTPGTDTALDVNIFTAGDYMHAFRFNNLFFQTTVATTALIDFVNGSPKGKLTSGSGTGRQDVLNGLRYAIGQGLSIAGSADGNISASGDEKSKLTLSFKNSSGTDAYSESASVYVNAVPKLQTSREFSIVDYGSAGIQTGFDGTQNVIIPLPAAITKSTIPWTKVDGKKADTWKGSGNISSEAADGAIKTKVLNAVSIGSGTGIVTGVSTSSAVSASWDGSTHVLTLSGITAVTGVTTGSLASTAVNVPAFGCPVTVSGTNEVDNT